VSTQTHDRLILALRDLAKLVKGVQYYPPGHPAVKNALLSARNAFLPMLQDGENLHFTVRREGFFLDDKQFGKESQPLQKLAPYLFARRIQQIVILPDLSLEDLLEFSKSLALETKEIRSRGGIKEVLLQARITTIWLNETDLSKILTEKEKLEESAQPGVEEEDFNQLQFQPPEDIRDLRDVLKELRAAKTDQRFRELLQETTALIPDAIQPNKRLALTEAMALLCQFATNRRIPMQRRELTSQAINHVATRELVGFLIDFMCKRDTSPRLKDVLKNILVVLKHRAIGQLMEKLSLEDSAGKRKILVEALIRQGHDALPVLAEHLQDDRWFVVRNAVTVIGEIRHPDSSHFLGPLLQHEEIRVRREVVRALAKTGGQEAVNLLLKTVEGSDEEMARQALLSLGALKDDRAVPALVRTVKIRDPFMKRSSFTKDAIRSIGEIGSPEAIPALCSILRQNKLIKRTQFAEIRAAAAQALGEIGYEDARSALEVAVDDKFARVARQAALALKQLKKGSEHAE